MWSILVRPDEHVPRMAEFLHAAAVANGRRAQATPDRPGRSDNKAAVGSASRLGQHGRPASSVRVRHSRELGLGHTLARCRRVHAVTESEKLALDLSEPIVRDEVGRAQIAYYRERSAWFDDIYECAGDYDRGEQIQGRARTGGPVALGAVLKYGTVPWRASCSSMFPTRCFLVCSVRYVAPFVLAARCSSQKWPEHRDARLRRMWKPITTRQCTRVV
jgi:hypothetical protein